MPVKYEPLRPTINIYDDNSAIYWNGWQTTWNLLRHNGWVISVKVPYSNPCHPWHSSAATEKVYLRHDASGMLARITKDVKDRALSGEGASWYLDWLAQEKHVRKREMKEDKHFTPTDIPALLELVSELQRLQQAQKPKRRKAKARNIAEILRWKGAA